LGSSAAAMAEREGKRVRPKEREREVGLHERRKLGSSFFLLIELCCTGGRTGGRNKKKEKKVVIG
jgi:hypothetical protein